MESDPTRTLKLETVKLQPGQILANKYRITREIGRGGMGVVYEAEDIRLGRTVALKFLPPELTADPEARKRFIQEAQAASTLDHPHICTIHEVDEAEVGGLYIAMACYKGKSLREKIDHGPLEPAEAVEIALQVAEGLAKAHENGIVHRDIKPGNIMITPDGQAKILDFGLAKLAGEVKLTIPGTTLGTISYMSPEQARGDQVDERTDLWSLGVVLYEMASGELPFSREKDQAVLYAIMHEEPRPVRKLRPGFPDELAQIINKALAKEPDKRFSSAREMADTLQELKTRMTAGSYPTARGLTFRRSRKGLLLAAASISIAVLALAIWMLSRPSLAFENRDKLMVADADNLTGDKVFDLALRTAIEAGLQQSPYASVFDKPQIAETLRLMRMDPSARVDENAAYDICRFAGVRAFILPRILSAGQAYELEAILIDPVKRRHVDRIRLSTRGREEVLLSGIDKLTRQVRSRLGESIKSIEKADVPVAKVTTSSWEALDYFSLAQVKRQDGRFKDAVSLYELALEKDPGFVAARASLGLVLIQFMGQGEKGKEMLRQALKDAQSQGLPQRDQLPLKALHRQFVDGDLEGALAEYRTISQLFPDLMPPFNNAGRVLQALGRYDEAATMFEEAAKRAPRASIPLQNLWFLHMNFRKDAQAGAAVGRRIVELAPALANSHSFLGYSLAVQEKYGEAEKELRKALEIEPDHPYALANLAHVLFASDKAADAVPFYRKVVDRVKKAKTGGTLVWDSIALAMALREAGQAAEARKVVGEIRADLEKKLHGSTPAPGQWIALGALDAVAGDLAKADFYLRKARAAEIIDANDLIDLGELYALVGRPNAAIEFLKKSLEAGFSDYYFPVILPEFQSIRKHPEFRAIYKLGK